MSDTPAPIPRVPDLDGVTRADARRQRLFFALWPDDGVRTELSALAKRAAAGGGRLVDPDNIHLTLHFLGSIDPDRRECAESVAKRVKVPPFVLRLDQFGVWPKPRVAWCAPFYPPSELLRLAEALRGGLAKTGFEVESRPYQAHVTLARKLTDTSIELSHERILWKVGRFYLVESITYASGAEYRLLKSWPLRIV